jgi:hypothetical protein
MTNEQQMVLEFHQKFNGLISPKPTTLSEFGTKYHELRVRLIKEELTEYEYALAAGDLVGIADALGDLKYVIEGAAVSHGIDLDPIFREIHRSNMTKTGGGKDAGGKILKGPDYEPPILAPLLQAQVEDESGL